MVFAITVNGTEFKTYGYGYSVMGFMKEGIYMVTGNCHCGIFGYVSCSIGY